MWVELMDGCVCFPEMIPLECVLNNNNEGGKKGTRKKNHNNNGGKENEPRVDSRSQTLFNNTYLANSRSLFTARSCWSFGHCFFVIFLPRMRGLSSSSSNNKLFARLDFSFRLLNMF